MSESKAERIAEIEDECLDNYHAVRYTLGADIAMQVVCTKCQEKIREIGETK